MIGTTLSFILIQYNTKITSIQTLFSTLFDFVDNTYLALPLNNNDFNETLDYPLTSNPSCHTPVELPVRTTSLCAYNSIQHELKQVIGHAQKNLDQNPRNRRKPKFQPVVQEVGHGNFVFSFFPDHILSSVKTPPRTLTKWLLCSLQIQPFLDGQI